MVFQSVTPKLSSNSQPVDLESQNKTASVSDASEAQQGQSSGTPPVLLQKINEGKLATALTFAGQGVPCLAALEQLYISHDAVKDLVDCADRQAVKFLKNQNIRWSPYFTEGFNLKQWLLVPENRPSLDYLTSTSVSQAIIFTTQVAQYVQLLEDGLDPTQLGAISGHSQGMMSALFVSEMGTEPLNRQRFSQFVEYFLWQGFFMSEAFPPSMDQDANNAPMAAISGPSQEALTGYLARFNKGQNKSKQVFLSLYNTRTRHVVSGPASRLQELQVFLQQKSDKEAKEKKAGQRAGSPLKFTWENLQVGGAFHCPHMEDGYTPMLQKVSELNFEIAHSDLKIPVLCPGTQKRLDQEKDLTTHLVTAQFMLPVHWVKTVGALHAFNQAQLFLDLGPGDGVARLSRSCLRGVSAQALALSETSQRLQLFEPMGKLPVAYNTFSPTLIELSDGTLLAENRYTQTTGHLPVILPGMTPTTVEVDIVAAAANAGFTAELAGGGQVTERMFWLRMEELQEKLEPGREITFNSLHLDPYLWDLHLGKHRLVQKARERGYPICGVTISAGIPEKEEAVKLLTELFGLGIWLNALKPGTISGVKRVIEIAKALPSKTLFIHLEGGKAGGHHSFEDLDDLLLGTYSLIRQCKNLVLCVGGGVSSEDRAVSLLTGAWAKRYNQAPMPVDAVFLGTLAMACKEATASPQVKAALVQAAGTQNWVFTGQSAGEITSGKSQLNADIHYLDNAAARCGRLLDEVAGNASAVAERHQEIVVALNRTAKPYFGDVEQMTYAQALDRMVQLLAVGYGGRYEDGVWPDHSFRQRVFDFLRRTEGRLNNKVGTFTPLFDGPSSLDNPQAALALFYKAYPQSHTEVIHHADVHFFIHNICRRPGKPVNFIPVIDADVRRWYKADSLWQAQDPRYDSDQVLIIPGPEAIQGLDRKNEPVAALLGRFNDALITATKATQGQCQPRTLILEVPGTGQGHDSVIAGNEELNDRQWLERIATGLNTPLNAAILSPTIMEGLKTLPNPLQRLLRNDSASKVLIHNGGNAFTYQSARFDSEQVTVSLTASDNLKLSLHMQDSRGPLAYTINWTLNVNRGHLVIQQAPEDSLKAIQQLYGHHNQEHSRNLEGTSTQPVVMSPEQIQAYRSLTGLKRGTHLPLNALFSAAVEQLFELLCHKDVADGLLNLVHLENHIETFEAWGLPSNTNPTSTCHLSKLEYADSGRTLETEVLFQAEAGPLARMRSKFFITKAASGPRLMAKQKLQQDVELKDEAAIRFLLEHQWVSPVEGTALSTGQNARFHGELNSQLKPEGHVEHTASGHITQGGITTLNVDMEQSGKLGREHPIKTVLELLKPLDGSVQTPVKSFAKQRVSAPSNLQTFAEVSGDFNPIHTQYLAARLAGLGAPIVHGMWTAARLYAFIVNKAANGKEERLNNYKVKFLAPVPLGALLELEVSRRSLKNGTQGLHATAKLVGDDHSAVAVEVTVDLLPQSTAYVFPGQGIQQQGMGMAGYARSTSAKAVWDKADLYTRENLGFSVLKLVRDNPKSLQVGGKLLRHPKGLLNMTQFTQVAMAVLAQAQIAELKASGAYVHNAMTCGHSVGEYNALSAVVEVLPLEDVVDIVYHRGLVMHHLIARNAEGESPFRMGVIRPHYAGLSDVQAETLVSKISEQSGQFLQIVNYNVRGRQYSVTGHIKALELLGEQLKQRQHNPQKPAYIEVPGIDVPFHSSMLLNGVDSFRQTLDTRLPKNIDPDRLVGRYVPNLYPKPFSLENSYLEAVYALTKSPVLKELLEQNMGKTNSKMKPEQSSIARLLLIELLAYQFASPVRWIETQELLFTAQNDGGIGIERLIEVGVGYQPTVANMAQYSLALMGKTGAVQILNSEANADIVFERDASTSISEEVEAPEEQAKTAEPVQAELPAEVVEVAPASSAIAAAPAQDVPFTLQHGLLAMLALQAKVRPDQIPLTETIDGLFDGVSSRRNQVLMDIGTEFGLGTIDGAHEKALSELISELSSKASNYTGPGAYLQGSFEDANKRVFARSGLRTKDLLSYLESQYTLGEGLSAHVQAACALETREGASGRQGDLARLSTSPPADKSAAHALIDGAVSFVGQLFGQNIAKAGATGAQSTGSVDSAVVEALSEQIVGEDGVLMKTARQLADILGHDLGTDAKPVTEEAALQKRLDTLVAEHGPEYEKMLAQRFEQAKHVVYNDRWATAQADVAKLYYDGVNGRLDEKALQNRIHRLAGSMGHKRAHLTAKYFANLSAKRGHIQLGEYLTALADGKIKGPVNTVFTRPHLEISPEGAFLYQERPEPAQSKTWLDRLWPATSPARVDAGQWNGTLQGLLTRALKGPLDFGGTTALVTGASPNSIALQVVRHLLSGGARVILTTTSYNQGRLAQYQEVFRDCASQTAELHIVPFNQASFQDVDALVEWLFNPVTEQAGATVKAVKEPFYPDLIVPFAALSDNVTADNQGARSLVAARVQLHGVNRLLTKIAKRYVQDGLPATPCHILLPLSPNHGIFGGDGSYAETKAALEVLLNKWHSEQAAWAKATTFCGAKIGWVRGTGLMDQNDMVAAELEEKAGVYTFSSDEMGLLLASLLTREARNASLSSPLMADLTGGMNDVPNLGQIVGRIRDDLIQRGQNQRRYTELKQAEAIGQQAVTAPSETLLPLVQWPGSERQSAASEDWPKMGQSLEDMVVIVGAGEVGPWGSARTRFDFECHGELSPAAVLELAWTTGLIEFDKNSGGGSWVDCESGESIPESQIMERYHDHILERSGIRFADEETTGFDVNGLPVHTTVYLDRDFTFPVSSEAEAKDFVNGAPDSSTSFYSPKTESWMVTRKAGSEIKVLKRVKATRRVMGLVPQGFSFSRFGITPEMLESVDRLTLFNLIATVDAFIGAGLSPEELLTHLHPARVGNTQGAGIGGMRSLNRLYVDHLLDRERQNDTLQETLINVIAAYVVQSYVGSYGPMSNPVAACATAAVSVEEALDKIQLGKADFVVAGGFDDVGTEGLVGFADMAATAETSEMLEMGFSPRQMSRANDRRRKGFVEAQGGGTILMTRGDVAAKLGLPVLGVVAYAGSFSDGVHTSIPAPGMGALAAALGGQQSPLGRALRQYGLTADDIELVYKHDTSTNANDPNENNLHHQIQGSLGRTPGNPLWAVSQKSLTGHPKGGAAAWQLNGLCQAMNSGLIPGNRNLECVDDSMAQYEHIAFNNKLLDTGKAIKAGLVTSLGFGHVSALIMLVNRAAFMSAMDETQRENYLVQLDARQNKSRSTWAKVYMGEAPAFEKRRDRRFPGGDGTAQQSQEEAAMLLNPDARLNLETGRYENKVGS